MTPAIILARGGSKRIPGKNVRPFCGKPIIQYTIDAAMKSGVFDRVVVSTDSEQIAALSVQMGAEVPFIRPAPLADDYTTTIEAMRHAVETLTASGESVDYACCLYSASPFILSSDVSRGLELLMADPSAEFAFPVTTFPYSIFRSLQRNGDRVEMLYPEHESTRSQDLIEAYHDAGQFYWGTVSAWTGDSGIFSGRSIGIPIRRQNVQDIDTAEDWELAELMYKVQNNG